jgi:hypothetical protein
MLSDTRSTDLGLSTALVLEAYGSVGSVAEQTYALVMMVAADTAGGDCPSGFL